MKQRYLVLILCFLLISGGSVLLYAFFWSDSTIYVQKRVYWEAKEKGHEQFFNESVIEEIVWELQSNIDFNSKSKRTNSPFDTLCYAGKWRVFSDSIQYVDLRVQFIPSYSKTCSLGYNLYCPVSYHFQGLELCIEVQQHCTFRQHLKNLLGIQQRELEARVDDLISFVQKHESFVSVSYLCGLYSGEASFSVRAK